MRANEKVSINFLAGLEEGANRLFRDDLVSRILYIDRETTTIRRRKNEVKSLLSAKFCENVAAWQPREV